MILRVFERRNHDLIIQGNCVKFVHNSSVSICAAMGVVRDQSKTESSRTRNAITATSGTPASISGPLIAGWTIQALPYRELKRRFWHMSPGVLAFGLLVFPHADPISPTLQLIILTCCLAIGIRILLGFRQIQRRGEGAGLGAVGGYSLSVLGTVFLFPRHLELGLAVLAILAFGDGSATLLGSVFRGPRLPWNSGKSWIGMLGFVVVGSTMAAWIYWGETHNLEASDPPVSFEMALFLTAPAVVAAAIAESLRSRINDNIRVGVVAAVALVLLHGMRSL
jgi:dolichol kinase